jgi:hypothetical protein
MRSIPLTSAKLLSKHDSSRCDGSPAESRNGEKLCESCDVVVLSGSQARLRTKLGVDVVQVSSGL